MPVFVGWGERSDAHHPEATAATYMKKIYLTACFLDLSWWVGIAALTPPYSLFLPVVPANAGTQCLCAAQELESHWIPAFAGMTTFF